MITPVGFLVIVKPDQPKEKLKNDLIHIPETVLDKERLAVDTGILIAIGSKAWMDQADGEPWAKVGDHVVFAKYGGKILEDPETGEKVILLQDRDIIGLI